MALIAISAAIFIELRTEKGLSTTLAGFLTAIVTTFGMANYAATKEFMKSKNRSGNNGDDVGGRVDALCGKIDTLTEMNSPEAIAHLTGLLTSINQGISEVKATTGQVGTAVVNVNKEIKKLMIGGNQ